MTLGPSHVPRPNTIASRAWTPTSSVRGYGRATPFVRGCGGVVVGRLAENRPAGIFLGGGWWVVGGGWCGGFWGWVVGVLVGRTALVTGASRGIGRGIALRLAGEGAVVGVHYRGDAAAAAETLAEIRGRGGCAFGVRAELGCVEGAETLFAGFDAGVAGLGVGRGLDILVNNAGVSGSARIDEVTPELFDRIFSVNVRSLLFVAQLGLRRMGEGGRVINVSSAATRIAYPESVVYSMSKGAVDTFTLALAKEVGPRGITVNAVAPGFVETDMNVAKRSTPDAAARLAGWSVFGRLGRTGDIADIVAFLASDDSRWITGQCIDASGGSRL
ncbi:SDR family oxidoreductase [Streptomyces spiralis]|uniref:SDR family oxidoreductase n=1 Tax=Streptomyces spiralis TaxID=66376 RepID=UPI00369D64B0